MYLKTAAVAMLAGRVLKYRGAAEAKDRLEAVCDRFLSREEDALMVLKLVATCMYDRC